MGWGQVPESQPSLYGGTTILEGTVEAVSSLAQLTGWDWARSGCSKLRSPRVNEVLDPTKHICLQSCLFKWESITPASWNKAITVPCYKLMSLKMSLPHVKMEISWSCTEQTEKSNFLHKHHHSPALAGESRSPTSPTSAVSCMELAKCTDCIE